MLMGNICNWLLQGNGAIARVLAYCKIRARKLYTSSRIYEWKFGKGEWKLPFTSPTGRVDIFGFVIIFD